MKILVIEDELSLRVAIADELTDRGHTVTNAGSGEEALPLIPNGQFDLVITDLVMDKIGGMDILRVVKQESPTTEVLLITAHATVATALAAMKLGAIDYLCKPFGMESLLHVIANIGETIHLKRENESLKEKLKARDEYRTIIGKSSAMQKVFKLLDIVRATSKTVLIIGETGTGKQVVAEAIHHNGERRDNPFVTVSCASLSKEVLESELFGHEKGAFTGAIKDKRGRFEIAHKGTLFLDDMDDIPLETQIKLLRIIETGQLERVGGEETVSVDTRIIAASKLDLETLVIEGRFRKDLFYRLNVIKIQLPPLRDRKEDIPLLVEHFLKKHSPGRTLNLSQDIMGHLLDYHWDGNVRELEHAVERLILLATDGMIDVDCLPILIKQVKEAETTYVPGSAPLPEFLYDIEKNALVQALGQCDGNKIKTAQVLGIPLATLKTKLAKFGL